MKTDTKTLIATMRKVADGHTVRDCLDRVAADRLEELERELLALYKTADKLEVDKEYNARLCESLRADWENERALADRLRKSAQALVDRWETPFWKDSIHTGKFIRSLDDALAAWKEARNE
jgi:hypothetical protein